MVTFRLDSESISLDLPDAAKKEVDFLDSTFFTVPNRHLPSPEEVAALSDGLGKISRPNTLVIGGLNLLTKFGPHVTPLEAANLWMVRRVFNNTVPVPEVFGWRTDDWGYVFIYTEFIKGPTLFEHWPSLGSLEKRAICDQLAGLAQSLRQLEQDPSDPFIGSIKKQSLEDYIFTTQPQMGPFTSVKEFNDQFALLHQLPFPTRYDDPNRR